MDQAIPCGDDHAPGYLWIGLAHFVRDVGGSFADQFQVAHSRIVVEAAGDELNLVHSLDISDYFLGKADHVIQIEAPSRTTGSDMQRFFLDEWTQFRSQGFLGDQINRVAEQVFQIEHHAEVAL